jgi:rhodanese-related sulfurtransferase
MHHAALAPGAAVARVNNVGSGRARTTTRTPPIGNQQRRHVSSFRRRAGSSSSRGALVAAAANAPFPVGTPEANGVVPGVGKGMPKWPEVWEWLNYEKKMNTVDSAETVKMMKKGAVLLDVRFEPDYEKWSVPGSTHVPYVTGGVLAKMRLPGFKKKNADFVAMVQEAVPDKNAKIILACIWGGSLVREPPKNRGLTDNTKGSGSLPGAFELYQAGYKNLYHLYGGRAGSTFHTTLFCTGQNTNR